VDPERSLVIRDPRVVDDARTWPGGPWAFGTLVRNMAPEGARLGRWLGDRFQEGACRLPPQYGVKCEYGRLIDLDTVPARLVAIVNRVDLATAETPSGELRLVYQIPDVQSVDDEGTRFENLEFDLAAVRDDEGREVRREEWARRFAALGGLELGSEAYLAALDDIVQLVTRRGAAPDRPVGSALRRLRHSLQDWNWGNPVDRWALRSNGLLDTGELGRPGLEKTPVNGDPYRVPYQPGSTKHLLSVLVDHEAAVLDGSMEYPAPIGPGEGTIPDTLVRQATHARAEEGTNLTLAPRFDELELPPDWNPQRLERLRVAFAKRTCHGCHAALTATSGKHLQPRAVGVATEVSPFLEHVAIPERAAVLRALTCGEPAEPACEVASSCGVDPTSLATPILNEVRLVRPVGRFVEIAGAPGTSLDGYVAQRGIGSTPLDGFTIGENGYFVLAYDATVPIAPGAGWRVVPDTSFAQSAPPVVVVLRRNDEVLDAVAIGEPKTHAELAEGAPAVPEQDGGNALSRTPNASDSGSNATDWREAAPTPGRANCGCSGG
jgi:hypothetical protein